MDAMTHLWNMSNKEVEIKNLKEEISHHGQTCGECCVLYNTTMYGRCDIYRKLQERLEVMERGDDGRKA